MALGGKADRLLLIRFSALGDVTMLLPVLAALRRDYPGVFLVLLSRPFARELLAGQFSDVECFTADLKGRHRGLLGLWRLAREVRAQGAITRVVDLHAVLRSVIVSCFLRILCLPRILRVSRISKGRREKRRLIRQQEKVLKPLMHTVQRYARTLERAGYPVKLLPRERAVDFHPLPPSLQQLLAETSCAVGVAPFAKHEGKCYPEPRMSRLLMLLLEQGITPLIFGGGASELKQMRAWRGRFPGVVLVPDYSLSLQGEISLMASLPLMLTMDSANMHLASWAGTRVLSIWGATHPYAGFLGWGLDPTEAVIQRENLPCRPCSVFGNKPCRLGGYPCMDIAPEEVLQRVLQSLPGTLREKLPGNSV